MIVSVPVSYLQRRLAATDTSDFDKRSEIGELILRLQATLAIVGEISGSHVVELTDYELKIVDMYLAKPKAAVRKPIQTKAKTKA